MPDNVNKPLGPIYTMHQYQHCNNSEMTLAILFSLKTMESLENGLQPNSGVTLLFSTRRVLLVASQSCRSVDPDSWCKRALAAWRFTDLEHFFLEVCGILGSGEQHVQNLRHVLLVHQQVDLILLTRCLHHRRDQVDRLTDL